MTKKIILPILEKAEVVDTGTNGMAVARSGKIVVFVKNAVPGDVIDIKVTKKRSSYYEGAAIKFHHYSSMREEPFCDHFGICGGCSWQNLKYSSQLMFKQKQVENNLKKIANVAPLETLPIIPSENNTSYRNKLEFTFSNKRWLTDEEMERYETDSDDSGARNYGLGFHIPGRFDKVLDIKKCHLQAEPSNAIRMAVRELAIKNGLLFFDIRKQTGFLRNLIIRTSTTGDLMVILSVYRQNEEAIKLLLGTLSIKFPEITSLMYVVNPKKNDTIADLDIKLFSGKDHIMEKIGKLIYRIGPKSFFQTNTMQAEQLYRTALDFAQLERRETVYDLYTGSGAIANYIAHKAGKVIGIEYIPEAVEDAKTNSKINSISNTTFFSGDIKDLLTDEFIARNGKPDLIITDPPRTGMHTDVVKKILDIFPQKVIYISCNSATQARDLALMSGHYTLAKMQPVDMFPHTVHVENVCLLLRK